MARGLFYAAFSLLVVSLGSVRADSMRAAPINVRNHVGAGSLAAGRAHTVIAKPDGRVYAWGAGGRGQLGIGGFRDHWSPAEVPDLVGIVSVSAGASHSVALSSSGVVYGWGANTFGRLGDGSSKRRDRPIEVPGLIPVKAIAAGRAHTLALVNDGRVFAWGLNANGQIGNGKKSAALTPQQVRGLSDVVAIAAGDAHSLAVTRDGSLFAWGRNDFSALGDGTTRDRTTPVRVALRDVVAVAAGGAHSLALVRSGFVYSWGRGASGELGTGSTKVASTPKLISGLNASAVAAGRHFSGAITTSGQAVTWGANGSGQLGDGTTTRRLRPVPVIGGTAVASLALGGAHGIAVSDGGDIRTWGDGERGRLGSGAELDQDAPIEIISDVPDWGVEPGEDAEPADSTPPVIQAIASPPVQEGWMITPVTVSFECKDDRVIASCSSPIQVSQDGVTEVVGTAIDLAGNRATASLVVRLDLRPPVLTVANFPDTTEAEEIVVSGTVSDQASGLSDAKCNGGQLAIDAGAYQCPVSLRPGRNDVVLEATDAVGHWVSTVKTITRVGAPTALFLTPASRTASINEPIQLALRDEFGALVEHASWTSADDTVISLSGDEPPVITAVGIGATTVVAEKDGLRAEAIIKVVPDVALGDARWTLPAIPGLTALPPMLANRVDSMGPYLFSFDSEDWDKVLVRAVTAEGEVLWQQHVNGVPFLADAFGGLIAGVPDAIGDYRGLVRIGDGAARPWRYASPGILGAPAQAHDGTIYLLESAPNGRVANGIPLMDKSLIVLDGATGRLIGRTTLAAEVNAFEAAWDGRVIEASPPIHCRSYRHEDVPATVGPFAGADGRGYLLVRRHEIHKRDVCSEPKFSRPDRTIRMGLDLIVVSRESVSRTIPLYSTACDAVVGSTLTCDYPVRAFQLMPDGIGGTLATWQRATSTVGNAVVVQRSMTRIEGDALSERDVALNFTIEMIGQDGLAMTYGANWDAIDVRTGEPKWSGVLPDLTPLAARPDGGVAALDWSTMELANVNATGAIESTQPFGLDWRSFYSGGTWFGLKGDQVAAVAGQLEDATRYASFDTKTGQLRERRPGIGIWLKTHTVVPGFEHTSIRVAPADQNWLIQNKARFEQCEGAQQCVPLGDDIFGNLFFTIGAGAGSEDTNILCNGTLTKGFNRPHDVRDRPTQPLVEIPADSTVQSILINSLITRVDAFSNTLAYYCFPEERPGMYNSNSFAHGLLHAASVAHDETPPTRKRLPGWATPVPPSAFFKD
ncbi:MAG TPA: hypothetical protein VNT81_18650 [Vicinamibacterales bacterium]|nr:hypothetical protein [Vicinamibacterales bacterium]